MDTTIDFSDIDLSVEVTEEVTGNVVLRIEDAEGNVVRILTDSNGWRELLEAMEAR